MHPRFALFLTSMLLLACNEPAAPIGSTTDSSPSSSGSSSSGSEATSSTSTSGVDDTIGTSAATGGSTSTSGLDDTSTSASPGSSEGSESTGSPPANGCADGEREAFADEVAYPDIAGCSGGWSVPGVVVNNPFCDREGGDDGPNPTGQRCSVEDLCSEDWHVCESRIEVMDAGVANCSDEAFGGAFFATRQSGMGSNTCNPAGLNDVFGCGDIGYTMITGCAPLNRGSANGCVELPDPWSCGVALDQEAQFLIKEGPEFGGVLCCRD